MKSKKQQKTSFTHYFKAHWQLYAMILVPLIMVLIFAYGPMYGILIAFKDYKVSLGIWSSPWAENHGLNNFIRFFNNYNFKECFRNTLVLSCYSLFVNLPCSVILALALNYCKNVFFKKTVQLVSYYPYFISTIVFVGIINLMMDTRVGIIGRFFSEYFNTNILASASAFPTLYVWTGVWQGVGFGAIIYIAALAGVDMQLHEAAIIDGATLLQRIRYVDIPAILPTAVIMLILNLGSILSVSTERVLAMQNPSNLSVAETISTYAYKASLVSTFPDYPYSTAIGLFQSVVGLILIVVVNKIADKVAGLGFM